MKTDNKNTITCSCECDVCYDNCPGDMNTKIVQLVEFKKSVNVIYYGRIRFESMSIVKAFVLRSGKPSYVVDSDGNRCDFEYFDDDDKNLIYRTIIRNLMFKELI